MYTVKAYLPVSESFGFNGELRQATGGQAFPQMVFDHWAIMNGSPLEKGSKLEELVQGIRKRKVCDFVSCSQDTADCRSFCSAGPQARNSRS